MRTRMSWIIADGTEARLTDRVVVLTDDGEQIAAIDGVHKANSRPILRFGNGAWYPVPTSEILRLA